MGVFNLGVRFSSCGSKNASESKWGINECQWGRCCNLIQGVQGSLNSGVGWSFSDNLDTNSVLGCSRHLCNCFTILSCVSYHTPATFAGPWKFPVMVATPSQPSWIMAVLSSPVELVLLSTLYLLEFFWCSVLPGQATFLLLQNLLLLSLFKCFTLPLGQDQRQGSKRKVFNLNQKSKLLTHIVLLFHLV
jgi:hypothetical protein